MDGSPTLLSRLWAYGFSLALVAAVVAPALDDPLLDDDFPLSTYPMFARPMPHARAELPSVWVVMEGGERRRVAAPVLGSRDVLQALVRVRQTLERGPEATRALCREVAQALSTTHASGTRPRRVEIVTHWLDAVYYFAGNHEPLASRVHARCRVGGP